MSCIREERQGIGHKAASDLGSKDEYREKKSQT
jgi:hypothetical protein